MSRKLILHLDPLPAAITQTATPRPPKRTNGPLTGRGGSTGRRSSRQSTTLSSDHDGEDAIGGHSAPGKKRGYTTDPELKHEDDGTSRKQRRRRQDKDDSPIRTTTHVIGIDVGMTGSGMSAAPERTDASLVTAEMDWPKARGKYEKIPSMVALREDNQNHSAFSSDNSDFFGFNIPKNAVRRSFFKASLNQAARPSRFDDPVLKDNLSQKLVNMGDLTRSRTAMVAALKHLRSIHLKKVANRMGGENAVEDVKFIYVITHPAAYDEIAKYNLVEMAKEAGYENRLGDEIHLLSEAYAAGMASFVSCRTAQRSDAWRTYFKQNSIITILDLGGLTGDCISLKIKSNDPNLVLEEASVTMGGKCGTAAIHCRLLKALAEKFGLAFTSVDSSELVRGTHFFDDCESIIRDFEVGDPNRRHKIVLELAENINHPDVDKDVGEIYLRGHEIQTAIDGTLHYAKELLKDQWQQVRQKEQVIVDTTIITGGGSIVDYSLEQLRTFCQQHGVRAIQAENPESTVCRGAVIHKLSDNLLGKRLCRSSFGIEVQKGGRQYINWFVNQGDVLDTTKPQLLKELAGKFFLSLVEVNNDGSLYHIPIYAFDGVGPRFATTNQRGVNGIATITISVADDFSDYLKKKLRKRLRDEGGNRTYMDAKINLSINQDGRMYFEALHGRAALGKGALRMDDTRMAPETLRIDA